MFGDKLTKVAGKLIANFVAWTSCETSLSCLASKIESRPAELVMAVTDF